MFKILRKLLSKIHHKICKGTYLDLIGNIYNFFNYIIVNYHKILIEKIKKDVCSGKDFLLIDNIELHSKN